VNRLEIDQAVFYALLLRIWQLVAGLVSVALISVFFSQEVQGYYYTFSGLLALQSFFELGLHIVIISFGEPRMVASAVGSAAIHRRRRRGAGSIDRFGPLDRGLVRGRGHAVHGCGVGGWQSSSSRRARRGGRLVRALESAGGAQWSAVVDHAAERAVGRLQSSCRGQPVPADPGHRRQRDCLDRDDRRLGAVGGGRHDSSPPAVRWLFDRRPLPEFLPRILAETGRGGHPLAMEIWPMQWRIALVGLFSYFEFSLYTPVMFYYHGPILAGQMGMTWTLLMAVQAAALSWVQSRAPRFGMLAAVRDFRELDRIFLRLTAISWAAVAGAARWPGA
jgi:hypothetical protein